MEADDHYQFQHDEQLGGVVVLTDTDVMCGVGHEKREHPGNALFKCIASQFTDAYARAASKRDKMRITKSILDLLTERKIRFLKKSSIYEYWYVAGQKVARDKIGHFLRLSVTKNRETLRALSNQQQSHDSPALHCASSTALTSFLIEGQFPQLTAPTPHVAQHFSTVTHSKSDSSSPPLFDADTCLVTSPTKATSSSDDKHEKLKLPLQKGVEEDADNLSENIFDEADLAMVLLD